MSILRDSKSVADHAFWQSPPMETPCRRSPIQPEVTPTVGLVVPAVRLVALLVLSTLFDAGGLAASDYQSLSIDTQHRQLRGREARMQLVVTGHDGGDRVTDATHEVQFTAEPAGIVEISRDAMVIPLADGDVTITAHVDELPSTATIAVSVSGMGQEMPLSFPNEIVPIFTKLSCNGGGCHGKAAGQNGFKLSLLGFEPREDYEHLVGEARGRRISPAVPGQSLLLLKAMNAAPHGGGQRLEMDSHEYRMLYRWIAQGLPYGDGNEPQVTAIEVFPAQRRLAQNATQQLSVIATYSDDTRQDITRGVVFESNDTSMASVSPTGLVTLSDLVGDVAVMARYQGHVAVFRADIPSTTPASEPLTPPANNLVDVAVFHKLQSLGIPASPPCDDATFLRRVTLDIAGRLPTLAETQAFENEASSEKRSLLVDKLLDSRDYAEHFAGKWNSILRNRRQRGSLQFATRSFHDWIRDSFADNKPYDQFVHELITASGSVASNPAVVWYQQVPDANQRVEDTAQLFLGQRVQCARCHHHPYEKWSQADYAHLTAFFTTVSSKAGDDSLSPDFFARVGGASSPHPKTGQALPPAGLDAVPQTIAVDDDPRAHLADWMTQPENPFFARALVNRYWQHFLGRGLVEPVDDMRVTNPPSNPELLDGLSTAFIQSGYDLKALIRLIVTSQTYAVASDPLDANLGDRRSYSRFYPKRMRAEVLLDSVDVVTQTKTSFAGVPVGTRAVALPDTSFDSYFLTVFGLPMSKTACECERASDANLAQSLHLLNSEEMQKKLSEDGGRAAAMAADETRSDEAKTIELYQVALSRLPTDSELQATLAYLNDTANRREAFEDLVWSLLNSKEFLFIH